MLFLTTQLNKSKHHAMEIKPLKVYFFPFLAPGHMIPFSQLARLFAARGVHVTIITTPFNAQLLQNSIENDRSSGYTINIHIVNFPSKEVSLDPGLENLFNVIVRDSFMKLYQASVLLQHEIEPFLETNPPDCIVSDFLYPWVTDIVNRLKIPRLVFNPFCLFSVCMIETIRLHPELKLGSNDGPFFVTGLPHPITLTLKPPEEFNQVIEPFIEAELDSYGLIINNFTELEGKEHIEYYEKLTGHKAWHIGPTSLMLREIIPEKCNSSVAATDDQNKCLTWLNSKEPNSVLYISFGSLCRLPDNQLFEIAVALEASGHSFIWVVHRKDNDNETEEDNKKKWLPKGFEERTNSGSKGMIIRKWAPQEMILNHNSTGGFFTHCGWTSVTEGVSAGVPMITMPAFLEQHYNEKLITQVHGFGIEVGLEEWVPTAMHVPSKLVWSETIERAIRRLMDGGEEGNEVRRKAKEMKKKAMEAVGEGGSTQENLNALIEEIKLMRANKG